MITKLDDLEVLFSSAKESAPLMQVIQQACLGSAIFLQYIRKTAKTYFSGIFIFPAIFDTFKVLLKIFKVPKSILF